MFIVVREPLKEYDSKEQYDVTGYEGLNFPYTRVEITTLVTPNLDDPTGLRSDVPGPPPPQDAFWPRVGGEDFQFHLVGYDRRGRPSEFSIPLVFLDSTFSDPKEIFVFVKKAWDFRSQRTEAQLSGQKIAYAIEMGGPGLCLPDQPFTQHL